MVEITYNPFQGLKRENFPMGVNGAHWLKSPIIPFRDWNKKAIASYLLFKVEITYNPFQGLKHNRLALAKKLNGRRVEITYNPFQGLKPVVNVWDDWIIIVEITYNPFQGLKQLLSPKNRGIFGMWVEITYNPFQGLKPDVRKSSLSIIWLKSPIIPFRDWNIMFQKHKKQGKKVEITYNPFQGLKLGRHFVYW